ncbi:DsbA family protein [Reinekea blandensis]|uniref:DSBA-like thioredoxin domain-containing protein n=1 Tax=Reinekea blandensis MED297 TaxID=314283 RepID=A4BK96_9GAMM|nr:DsbA family protein [Reinekea blandensis]EAR07463.1 hypothetical protein MED297_05089 [Reinekea sp. MED297] [Reinekea blandensis MED297]
MTPESIFYYVHDPMCSWCWAHRPEWDRLKQALTPIVTVQTLVGGLAPDSDVPMPAEQQEAIAGYWRRIEGLLGRPFNYDFWTKNTPRRSTYPACRAVIAARWQGQDEAMTDALQEAYYLRAMNPSDTETHLTLAAELGLDVDKLARDLMSAELESAFQDELTYARQLPIQGFPSMVLKVGDSMWEVPLDYRDHRGALAFVQEKLSQS